ncbi:MAG: lipase family protein [Methylococcus sp.]
MFDDARTALELCRFAYKMYAQSLKYPLDPFYESNYSSTFFSATRDRVMRRMHEILPADQTGPLVPVKADDQYELDPIEYHLDSKGLDKLNPMRSIIYRGGVNEEYVVFTPERVEQKISTYSGVSLQGDLLSQDKATGAGGSWRCTYFQGLTGATVKHSSRGWRSYLGAVLCDPDTQTVYVTFRGSRSGNGERAAMYAQFKSIGNPDWVTDLNWMKDFQETLGGKKVQMSAGFWFSLKSARQSIKTAYENACRGVTVRRIVITGHSLGGALAQCCYIDLKCGELKSLLNLADGVTVDCYPISAPPVCLGAESMMALSLLADASHVHHYFCPRDMVHASPLTEGWSAPQVLNWALITPMAHPVRNASKRDSPYHFGSEIWLDSSTSFPDAHEPYEVWMTLWKQTAHRPSRYWNLIKLNHVTGSITTVPRCDPIDTASINRAVIDSFDFNIAMERAVNWYHGVSVNVYAGQGFAVVDDYDKKTTKRFIQDVYKYYGDAYLEDNSFYSRYLPERTKFRNEFENFKRESGSKTAGCVLHTLSVAMSMQRIKRTMKDATRRRVGKVYVHDPGSHAFSIDLGMTLNDYSSGIFHNRSDLSKSAVKLLRNFIESPQSLVLSAPPDPQIAPLKAVVLMMLNDPRALGYTLRGITLPKLVQGSRLHTLLTALVAV